MERVEGEALWLRGPCLTDEFVWREACEGLQAAAEVVGVDKVVEMLGELLMAVIMKALDGCFFDGPVHPLDLPIGPGMVDFGEPMLDAFSRQRISNMWVANLRGWSVGVAGRQAELDAVVGQDDVDVVGNRCNECREESRSGDAVGLFD